SLSYWVQPPDAENRTSGGVGEVTDTIRYPDPITNLVHIQIKLKRVQRHKTEF
ncbi:hypothetical protein SAMN05428978_10918, partial [Nitrosomonas sp. Nm34]